MTVYNVSRWLANSAVSMLGLAAISCTTTPKPSVAQVTRPEPPKLYSEKYRPQYHFSPREGWMGDPDGLVYYGGYYHMFWWGHAISKDLVHWTELPWPMLGDDGSFKYYTGSVVVDKDNSAGFGANSMVAIYSMHNIKDNMEMVGLSSSRDYTDFQYFGGNPVLDVKSDDFRDPQVFWHAPTKKWVMLITYPGQRKISFFSSADLKKWQHLSDFRTIGAQGNSWEVPDLFQLPVDGDSAKSKWVLTVGVSPNKTQYFIGDFDGTRFTLDAPTREYLTAGSGIDGTVFADFNGQNYGDWTATGKAFGAGPSRNESFVKIGAGYVDSFGSSDADTGTLTSPEFTVGKKAINFLFGGGHHPKRNCINLLVDGKIVRSTTGDNNGGLQWNGWDVRELIGKKARIQVVDSYSGSDFGHLMLDHIVFSDTLNDSRMEHALWADFGSDFYAARSWRDIDNVKKRTTWVGWLGNWDYANDVPSSWGKGFQSIPRELELKSFPEGVRLVQKPIPELQALRGKPVQLANRAIKQGTTKLAEFTPSRNTYEIEAELAVDNDAGFNLLVGDGRKLVLGYDAKNQQLYLDRSQTSDFTANQTFNDKFPRKMVAPLASSGTIKLHIFVDQSSIEVLADDGKVVLSALTFPGEKQTGLETFSQNGEAQLVSFKAWELNSIWNQNATSIPGTIEAEDFDQGGQGVGYKDADPENQGGEYRPEEGVDIEKNAEGGFNVAWMAPTEWLSYTVKADYSRDHDFTFHIAGEGGQFHLELDGQDISGPIKVPATGNFQKWAQVTARAKVPFGEHQLRFCVDAGSFNLDKIEVATAGSQLVSGGTYQIIARHSGRTLDSAGTQDGAQVQQWEWLKGDNQQWKIELVGDGYYKITSKSSGKVLDVNGGEDGASTLQWPWQDNDNQKWELREIGGGYFTILHKGSGKALEIAENSKQNGGKVQQWRYLGGASQQWMLKRLK